MADKGRSEASLLDTVIKCENTYNVDCKTVN